MLHISDKVILNARQLLRRAVLLTSSSSSSNPVLSEGGDEQGRRDRCSFLITGQVLLTSQWQRGAGRTVSPLSSTCSPLFLLVFPQTLLLSLLSNSLCRSLFAASSYSHSCFFSPCVYPASAKSYFSVYYRASELCALCDGADFTEPYHNYIPTWYRLTVNAQWAVSAEPHRLPQSALLHAMCAHPSKNPGSKKKATHDLKQWHVKRWWK